MYIGQRIRRREDLRFLTGEGNYVDDVSFPDLAHVAFVRSPHAKARLRSIDVARASALPGVLKVLTAADWRAAGLGQMVCSHTIPFSDGRPMNDVSRPAFAEKLVCHVGDIVAAVVGVTRNAALDGAEAVEIDYEPLPAIVLTKDALLPDAPLVHERFGSNLATEVIRGNREATEAAFARAAHVTTLSLINSRVACVPMEPISYVARYNRPSGETTLWATAQRPHNLRQALCRDILNMPEHKLRVIAPDVGGSFGVKGGVMPEVATVVWMARTLNRPVKWTSARSESLMTETQARDHYTEAAMAFDENGVILGLKVDTIAALGAYVSPAAPSIPGNSYPQTITGLYKTPNLFMRVRCVYTNTVPTSAYRGSGRPEAAVVNERLIENGAREMGIDTVEIRRRNLIAAHEFPYKTPVGRIYDCGNPPVLLDKLVALAKYKALREEQARLRKDGVLMGIGIAGFLDKSGTGPSRELTRKGGRGGGYESCQVRVHSDGRVTLFVGTQNHGQGHETTYAAIAADRLGIPMEDIDVIEGDTGRVQFGTGTWGSRSVSVGGTAVYVGCDKIIAKARRIAAHVLGSDENDTLYEAGFFAAPLTNQRLSFAEVADIAYAAGQLPRREGFEPGLDITVFHDPPDLNDPLAIHLVVILIDEDTGKIRLRNYYTVDDCGVIINPMIVEGQIQGGLAQGIGQAMMEQVVYDESGQLLSGSLMDYAMPRAESMPPLEMDFHCTPAPSNPLGVKGGSETGTIGPPAAIGNAVVDALWHLGVRHVEMPMTSHAIWRTIHDAKMRAAS
jgi:carbon-monoxide dehydrogenase large subunit